MSSLDRRIAGTGVLQFHSQTNTHLHGKSTLRKGAEICELQRWFQIGFFHRHDYREWNKSYPLSAALSAGSSFSYHSGVQARRLTPRCERRRYLS